MDKNAVIHLDTSEAIAGLTFVCRSRAKRLADLLISAYALRQNLGMKRNNYFKAQIRGKERPKSRSLQRTNAQITNAHNKAQQISFSERLSRALISFCV